MHHICAAALEYPPNTGDGSPGRDHISFSPSTPAGLVLLTVKVRSGAIPLKKSVFEWKAAAHGGAVAEVEERLLPHVGKTGDGIGISLASLRRF